MKKQSSFSPDHLIIDAEAEVDRISESMVSYIHKYKKKGLVVAMSGGIDSSVVAALCVRALGKDRVTGLLLPERDSSADTLHLSKLIADHLAVETVHEDITDMLEAVGCYRRRDEAIKNLIPQYDSNFQVKIVLPSILQGENLRLFSVIVRSPDGEEIKARLTQNAYLGIVSATNFKQRVRKMLEYYHADHRNYAVAGTPNRLEYDQGFFVKLGDGAADIKPIAHLYKTQVYQVAEYLGIPEEIRSRPPTTDTYSLPQSQEEFFFSLPYKEMDLCLYGLNNNIPAEEVAQAVGLTVEQVNRVFHDIHQKRKTTHYLHVQPQLVEKIEGIN